MERYSEKLCFYSSMALDNLEDGIKAKQEGKRKEAHKYFSIAWGFNCMQENLEGMNMCDKLLRRLNPEVNLEQWHEYGRKMVEFAENLARAVGETLERPNIFNYDLELPKGIF